MVNIPVNSLFVVITEHAEEKCAKNTKANVVALSGIKVNPYQLYAWLAKIMLFGELALFTSHSL